MGDERRYRAATAVLLTSALTISGYHRGKADREGGRVGTSWREEGLPVAIGLRASGLTMVLTLIVYLIDPRWTQWSRLELPASVRWSGAGFGAAVLPLAYWVLRSLGKNITPTVSTREAHELVTDGPYRWVRHPLYTVGITFFASLSLLAANWFMGLASVAGWLMLLLRLPKEEAKLIERFGDEYRRYMGRTGSLLPRPGRQRGQENGD